VGKVGKDDLIDYYKEIVHEEEASYDVIEKKIIESFPEQRRKNAPNYMNQRKAIYDKYAPIFFLREVYKLSKKGNHKPGWYAGAKMIRKVSQGNPRMFIQIMCSLFDKARETALTPRAQHEVIYKFADDFCEATKALQLEGPTAYYNLNGLAKKIHEGIHGEYLVTGGLSFKASDKDSNRWMEVAIAYSKIIADDETKRRGISTNSKLMLSNAYAVKYWLPMRSSDKPIAIPALDENNTNSYTVNSIHKRKERKEADPNQLTIFEVMNNDRDQ
jgi:hypothetical protein